MMKGKESLPPSATHPLVVLGGVAGWAGAILLLRLHPLVDPTANALCLMTGIALGFYLPDLLWQKIYRRALRTGPPAATSWERTFTKCAGLAGSFGFIGALYWFFPEYAGRDSFYLHYWVLLLVTVPLWVLLAPFYLWWADRRMENPYDGLWHFGRAITLRHNGVDAGKVLQHLLGWLVKGFFLPLMFTYMCNDLGRMLTFDFGNLTHFKDWYDFLFFLTFFLDTSLISVTYLVSLRLTDTHIRSTEPSAFGWIVALVCYQPFWSLISRQYLAYESPISWGGWLGDHPAAFTIWGGVILALLAIYVWATASFGGRFSNLTHRGIITGGPYRYTKHPAYITKNLSWWMISVPFLVNETGWDSLRHCVLLLMLNGIYYLRAKTEERHLALDPVYEEYSCWIAAHGLLRWMNNTPGLSFFATWRPVFGANFAPAFIEDNQDR